MAITLSRLRCLYHFSSQWINKTNKWSKHNSRNVLNQKSIIYKDMINNIIYNYESQNTLLSYTLTLLHSPCQGSALGPLGGWQPPHPIYPQLHLTRLLLVERPTDFHCHSPKSISTAPTFDFLFKPLCCGKDFHCKNFHAPD